MLLYLPWAHPPVSSVLLFVEMHKGKRFICQALSTVPPLLAGWHQEDQNSNHLFPRKPMRAGKPGQEIGSLLLPQHPPEAPRELMWSLRAFCLYQHGPVSKHPDNPGVQGSVLGKKDDLIAQESNYHLHIVPSTGGQIGCCSHQHRLHRHGWNQQEQLRVWLGLREWNCMNIRPISATQSFLA